jgi:hypothetical protein
MKASKAPRTVISSAATELTAARMVAQQPEREKTARSVVTRSSGVNLKEIDFPSPPRNVVDEALCPLCRIPMPKSDLEGRKWR